MAKCTQKDYDEAKALKRALTLIRQILQFTVIWCSPECTDQTGLQAKLTNITAFAQELDDVFPGTTLQADLVSEALKDAGFVRQKTKKGKGAKLAVWGSPRLKMWKTHFEALTLLMDTLTDCSEDQGDLADDPFETPNAPQKKPKTSPATPATPFAESSRAAEDRGRAEALLRASHEEAPKHQLPVPDPPLGGCEAAPLDLSGDAELNALVAKAMAGGDGLGSAGRASGKSTSLINNLELPTAKKRSRQSLESVDGVIKVKRTPLISFEKWLEHNMTTLCRIDQAEKYIFLRYLVMIVIFHRDFDWWACLEFDEENRDKLKDGELDSLDPAPLAHLFYLQYGVRRKSSADEGPGRQRPQRPSSTPNKSKTGAKTCNWFNEQRGCKKGSSCSFKHACSKCGSSDHGAFKCSGA